MKKLIVLGIIATMVMGLAAAASADIDAQWALQIDAYNAAGQTRGTVVVATKVGGDDAFKPGEDASYPTTPNLFGVVYSMLPNPNNDLMRTDYRAPMQANETKIWDLALYCMGKQPQEMTLAIWVATGANQISEGGALRVWLQDLEGNVLWTAPYDTSGSKAAPNYQGTFAYGGGDDLIRLQVVASTEPLPEPGSMLAMFSGLVGLVGFGIRRRK